MGKIDWNISDAHKFELTFRHTDGQAPNFYNYTGSFETHAGFYGTPLDHLLEQLGAETLVLTGISAHQCILFTANEAYLRQYKLVIPSDCVAAKTSRQKQFALEYFKSVLHADTRPSPQIEFRR